jgi:hypothetical protein
VNSCPSLPSLAKAREPVLGGNSIWLSNKCERIVAKVQISLHKSKARQKLVKESWTTLLFALPVYLVYSLKCELLTSFSWQSSVLSHCLLAP